MKQFKKFIQKHFKIPDNENINRSFIFDVNPVHTRLDMIIELNFI